MQRIRFAVLFLAGLALISVAPAEASFHLCSITEIFGGTAQNPTAQYVVITCYSDFQDQFQSVAVKLWGPSGAPLSDFAVFTSNLPTTATNQKRILVATANAASLFGITPNQVASGSIPASGVVCFTKAGFTPDCVSWGAYTGNPNIGGSPAGAPAAAMPPGRALKRNFGPDNILQAADDTNVSSADFPLGVPAPRNFAGVSVSALTVALAPTPTLQWTQPGVTTFTVHKTGSPATIQNSPPYAFTGSTTYIDPIPNEFPGLTCYLVKP